jgi:hypothetical protein
MVAMEYPFLPSLISKFQALEWFLWSTYGEGARNHYGRQNTPEDPSRSHRQIGLFSSAALEIGNLFRGYWGCSELLSSHVHRACLPSDAFLFHQGLKGRKVPSRSTRLGLTSKASRSTASPVARTQNLPNRIIH